jgi:Streptomyces sporulation and cell division protein, SsgA
MAMSERNLYSDLVTHDLVLQCVDPVGTLTTVNAVLGYDPADPFAVTATFVTVEGDVVWTFARDLLARGLSGPAGEGDVHIWPCLDAQGNATVIIELCSPDGELVAQARTLDVYPFLNRTLAAVPAGTETVRIDLDQLIDQLLQPTEREAGR